MACFILSAENSDQIVYNNIKSDTSDDSIYGTSLNNLDCTADQKEIDKSYLIKFYEKDKIVSRKDFSSFITMLYIGSGLSITGAFITQNFGFVSNDTQKNSLLTTSAMLYASSLILFSTPSVIVDLLFQKHIRENTDQYIKTRYYLNRNILILTLCINSTLWLGSLYTAMFFINNIYRFHDERQENYQLATNFMYSAGYLFLLTFYISATILIKHNTFKEYYRRRGERTPFFQKYFPDSKI